MHIIEVYNSQNNFFQILAGLDTSLLKGFRYTENIIELFHTLK